MDHSLRGYLERQTTECLKEALEDLYQKEKCAFYDEIIAMVKDILKKREGKVSRLC